MSVAPLVLAQGVAVPPEEIPDYSAKTHHELTEIGTHWDELRPLERQALLREVKLRMARQKGPEGVLTIRTQRRYGRIMRSSDGRVLRIETQVVQVRPVNPAQDQAGFGVGFERRTATKGETGSSQVAKEGDPISPAVPVVRVNKEPQ